jgi:hypothetical protein
MYKGLGVEEAFQSDGYEIESSRENYVVISRKERWLHSLANWELAHLGRPARAVRQLSPKFSCSPARL